LANPDAVMGLGTPLKLGNTSTVVRFNSGGRELVIKRYNLKSFFHGLRRCWRPSRAWHSWLAGQRLKFLGFCTPCPLAMVEERFGPLHGRSWLVTEYLAADNLLVHLSPYKTTVPPAAEAAAIKGVFGDLVASLISHGDLKATNLLWSNGHLCLIDLDAMRSHRWLFAFRSAWFKDRKRFLRNWPETSGLRSWMERNLPDVRAIKRRE
jgi:hypothetical protein